MEADIFLPTKGSDRIADNLVGAQDSTSTCTSTVLTLEDAVQRLFASLAWPTQSRLDRQDILAITTSRYNALDELFANPLLLDQPQPRDYPVLLFDGGMANGTLNDGLETKLTQSQLAQSHFHLPQLDWSSNQEPSLPYNDQASMSVSVIVYPKLA